MARPDHPPPDDDRAALEAVWGREASARAEPVPAPAPGPLDAPDRADEPAPRRGPVVAAGVAAVLVLLAAGLVVRGSDGAAGSAPPPEASATTDATDIPDPSDVDGLSGEDDAAAVPGPAPNPLEPAWEAEVACPALPSPEPPGVCPVVADDVRVYVLERRDEVTTLVARAIADGAEQWSLPVPEASHLVRLPEALVVWTNEIVVVDPGAGVVRWTAPGQGAWAVGEDHMIVDDGDQDRVGRWQSRMTVHDVDTGAVTVDVAGRSEIVFVHGCDPHDVVVVSTGERLVARGLVDGAVRWDVAAPHHDLFDPVRCGPDGIVAVEDGELVVRSVADGRTVAIRSLGGTYENATLKAVVDDVAVVAAGEGLRGYRVTTLDLMWEELGLTAPHEAQVEAFGDGQVGFVAPGEVGGAYGPDGARGPRALLHGSPDVALHGPRVVEVIGDKVVVTPLDGSGLRQRTVLPGVRRFVAAPSHLVATTGTGVTAYALEG